MSRKEVRPKKPQVKTEDLINDLKRVYELNDSKYIRKAFYAEHGYFNEKTVSARFGSWPKALEASGLPARDNSLIGEKFGMLEVINSTDKKKYNYRLWLCRCECGETCYRTVSALKVKGTVSCGCRQGLGESMKYPERYGNVVKKGYENQRHKSGLNFADYIGERSNNTSGYEGVYKYQGLYCAELVVKKKRYRLFGFKTAEEAYEKGRLKLEEEHFPEDFRKELEIKRKSNNTNLK